MRASASTPKFRAAGNFLGRVTAYRSRSVSLAGVSASADLEPSKGLAVHSAEGSTRLAGTSSLGAASAAQPLKAPAPV
jgi:hypothetical protein